MFYLTVIGEFKILRVSGFGFSPVKCARNNNNWSTCGHPNAKVKLKIDKSKKLTGEVFVPWKYNTTGPPITMLQYQCK